MDETPTTTADDGFMSIEMIFTGRRLDRADKPFIRFCADDGTEASFDSATAMRMFRHAVVGGVFLHQRNCKSYKLSEKFVRLSGDPRMAEWRAADDAVDVAIRAKKRIAQAKADGKDSIAVALAPFRAEYVATDHIGRLALEVILLDALRRAS